MNLIPSASSDSSPAEQCRSQQRTLRHLFLTLFLRGRSSRGLEQQSTPKSIGQKLALTLVYYAGFGGLAVIAFAFARPPIFVMSLYLHAMTFAFLGMFLTSSVGEVLFNKEEADILLHRPIDPRLLLRAKIRVLVEASLWIAGAFNLAGFVVGLFVKDGGWRFVLAHAVSLGLEALFCAGGVVMVYQLFLRWFGREWLDGLITTAEVLLSLLTVVGSQLLPQLIRIDNKMISVDRQSWWLVALPPGWFAGFDDALCGATGWNSWLLATIAIVATSVMTWIAFQKLARGYGSGIQKLSETVSTSLSRGARKRWLDVALELPPLRWWLRDPVSRAGFMLTMAYLVRDREVKMRIYPAIAPMLMVPIMFLFERNDRPHAHLGGFGLVFISSFLSITPMMVLGLLQFSQQWQASDIFRVAPIFGPAPLYDGARKAVLFLMILSSTLILIPFACAVQDDLSQLLLILPGMVLAPIWTLLAGAAGDCMPLSRPTDEAKGAGRGLMPISAMAISGAISAMAVWSWTAGWFLWLIVTEIIVAMALYAALRRISLSVRWPSVE